MLIHKPAEIKSSEITPESVYLQRRQLLAGAVAGGLVAAAGPMTRALADPRRRLRLPRRCIPAQSNTRSRRNPTPFEEITNYNNFYEFGEEKTDPAENSGIFTAAPWSVTIDGEAEQAGTFTLEDILRPHPLEERIYRFRCVEAWSMVIPWVGFPLADLLKRFNPTSAPST